MRVCICAFYPAPLSVNNDQVKLFNITWCGVWIIVEVIMAEQISPAGLYHEPAKELLNHVVT